MKIKVTRNANRTYLATAWLGARCVGHGVDRSEKKAKARAKKQAERVQQLIGQAR